MSDISVVMGSKSDWPTVKETCDILDEFGVSYEKNVISAHRMPNEMFAFAQNAVDDGVKVIIACAGGSSPSPRNDCGQYPPTSNRDSGTNKGSRWHGLAFINCSNASGNSGGNHCDWKSRR